MNTQTAEQGNYKIKTRRTTPEVFYTDAVLKSWQTNDEANKLCIKAVGQIVMGMTGGNTGWHEDGKVFLQFDKKTNILTADLFNKFK